MVKSTQSPKSSSSSKSLPVKKVTSRQKILNAAARCFRDHGYAGTTLQDIAERAGMQAGSLYYHFESKEQMLEEVLDTGILRVYEAVRSAVEGLPSEATHRQRIEAAVAAHLSMLLAQGDYTSANIRIFGQTPPAVQRRHLNVRNNYAEYWNKLLKNARNGGELRDDYDLSLIRMFIFGALNWSVEWFNPKKKRISDISVEFSRAIFDGVGVLAS